jgi:hypothetical protein
MHYKNDKEKIEIRIEHARIQNDNWNTDADCMSSGNQESAETLETCLAKVNKEGELKPSHPEPLASGSLLHITIH